MNSNINRLTMISALIGITLYVFGMPLGMATVQPFLVLISAALLALVGFLIKILQSVFKYLSAPRILIQSARIASMACIVCRLMPNETSIGLAVVLSLLQTKSKLRGSNLILKLLVLVLLIKIPSLMYWIQRGSYHFDELSIVDTLTSLIFCYVDTSQIQTSRPKELNIFVACVSFLIGFSVLEKVFVICYLVAFYLLSIHL